MPLILTEEALFKTPEASRPRSMSEWAQIWAQSRSHQRPIVGIDRHVLAESRGLESATLRVTAEIDAVCWILPDLAVCC